MDHRHKGLIAWHYFGNYTAILPCCIFLSDFHNYWSKRLVEKTLWYLMRTARAGGLLLQRFSSNILISVIWEVESIDFELMWDGLEIIQKINNTNECKQKDDDVWCDQNQLELKSHM